MVFSDKAEAGAGSKGLFGNRGRIDANFEFMVFACNRQKIVGKFPEIIFNKCMVILILGVGCDFAGGILKRNVFRYCWGFIVNGGNDYGFCTIEQKRRVNAFIKIFIKEIHLCGEALVEPIFENRNLPRIEGVGGCDADQVKADFESLLFNLIRQIQLRRPETSDEVIIIFQDKKVIGQL